MVTTCCVWCLTLVKVEDDFDQWKDKAVCSDSCKDAEKIWSLWMSDSEIQMRRIHANGLLVIGGVWEC